MNSNSFKFHKMITLLALCCNFVRLHKAVLHPSFSSPWAHWANPSFASFHHGLALNPTPLIRVHPAIILLVSAYCPRECLQPCPISRVPGAILTVPPSSLLNFPRSGSDLHSRLIQASMTPTSLAAWIFFHPSLQSCFSHFKH